MEYQALPNVEIENDPEEQALTPYIHDPSQDYPENSEKQSRWSHQQDLDDFFSRVYQYHQRHGYFCIVLSEILALVQFIFIVSFTVLVLQCIDYPVLFRSSPASRNMTRKIQFNDVILSPSQCLRHQHLLISLCVALAVIYWIYRFCRAVYNLLSFYNIRLFYSQALDIKPKDLSNMTWHEVQQRLSKAQLKHDLCVHKQILTELDIHNRLLRFKNYEVAMVNKGLLPPKIHIPFIGDAICFTNGFKFNLRLILFWGPYSPFDQRWHLRQEYKINSQRDALARQLSRFILLYGITNLLLSPFIFIWQVLNLFYGYTELVRREPGVLGSRRWSNYGRLYLRHFNELDHSLNQRLNRGYKPAIFYMNSFVNYSIIEVAKFVSFTTGAILAVLIILTVFDEDVLNVEHMLTMMTTLGVVIGICRSLIPDEHTVFDPEQMMQLVLAQVHYQPDGWKNHAHTDYVQSEFAQMFQLKYVNFLEELLSPFITPLILCFQFRHKSMEIIDFLRNFTVDVQGVGDVCSFAQLDVAKHGDLKWFSPAKPSSSQNDATITNDGKLELSLMHFHHTNPEWKMPKQCQHYLEKIQERALENIQTSSVLQQSINDIHRLQTSYYSDPQVSHDRSFFNNVTSTVQQPKGHLINSHHYTSPTSVNHTAVSVLSSNELSQSYLTGAISKADLPYRSTAPFGVLSKIHTTMFELSDPQLFSNPQLAPLQGIPGAAQLDMNYSALYMHELRHKYKHGDYVDLENISEDENHAKC